MKKIIVLLILVSLLTGCGKSNEKSIISDFTKKFQKSSGYSLKGNLSVHNNDDVYHYDVSVQYLKDHYYKVSLTNTANNHTQVILKNDDGVYVLTPAFNKSFKFQSDWPYDNSQIYLLDALVHDIQNDSKISFSEKNNQYIFKTKVHYPNNSKLKNQKLFFNQNHVLKKTIVYNRDGVDCMTMTYDNIKYSPKLSKKDFLIDSIIDVDKSDTVEESSSLDDIIYPLFVPDGTKLVEEESVHKENGKRVIMNYDGEKSFLLVEETTDVFQELTIIPSSGEPYFLMDTMGVVTDNSLSWSSGGVDFYIVSDVMSLDEMIEIAQSLGTVSSLK